MSLESGFEVRVSDSVTLETAVAGFSCVRRDTGKDRIVSPFRTTVERLCNLWTLYEQQDHEEFCAPIIRIRENGTRPSSAICLRAMHQSSLTEQENLRTLDHL